MKRRTSITLDLKVYKELMQKVKKGKFANLSFAVEYYCRMGMLRGL